MLRYSFQRYARGTGRISGDAFLRDDCRNQLCWGHIETGVVYIDALGSHQYQTLLPTRVATRGIYEQSSGSAGFQWWPMLDWDPDDPEQLVNQHAIML